MGTIGRKIGLGAGVKKWELTQPRSMDLVNTGNWGEKKKNPWVSIKLGLCVKDTQTILEQGPRPCLSRQGDCVQKS